VAQQVTVQAGDNGSLQPMAEAAQAATGGPAQPINVVADAGYSNGKQAEACEAKGILPHVPANRSVNSRGDGTLFDRTEFTYQPKSDTFLCPAGQTLARHSFLRGKLALKGGTALNLFYLGLKRLSVDIDLNYIGHVDRDGMLAEPRTSSGP
jgi:hypothetical protein